LAAPLCSVRSWVWSQPLWASSRWARISAATSAGAPRSSASSSASSAIIGLNSARRAEGLAITLLFAAGLFLGLGLGGGPKTYAEVQPSVVWQAAGATALFVGGLGSAGYAIRRDLSGGYRVLFVALLVLIVFGFISLLVSMPHADVIYAVLGLVIFGGYTLLDFNSMRRAGKEEVVPLAAGIFLDVLNVFLFFLELFGGRDSTTRPFGESEMHERSRGFACTILT
jgi:FtsH-binding integral membrane protein